MRVKISYTIDIDETPEEVAKLLNNTNEKLNNISNDILDASGILRKEKNCMSSYEKITEARAKLFKIDAALNDANTILLGYQQTLLAQETQNLVSQSDPNEPLTEDVEEKVNDEAN